MAGLVVLAAVAAVMIVSVVRLLGPPWTGLRSTVAASERREARAAAHWAAVRHLDGDGSSTEAAEAVCHDAAVDLATARAAVDLARSLRHTGG